MRMCLPALLGFSLVPVAVIDGAAQELSFWEQRTCSTRGSSRICSKLNLRFFENWDGPGTGLFLIGQLDGPGTGGLKPILPGAIGLLTAHDIGFTPDTPYGPGGWGASSPARWTVPGSRQIAFPALGGWSLATGFAANEGTDHWSAVIEGQAHDAFVWTWKAPLVEDFLFVWRGESEDGSVDFDCWQNPAGGEECLSTVPEPSTALLLVTGMVALAVVVNRRRSHAPNGRQPRAETGSTGDST